MQPPTWSGEPNGISNGSVKRGPQDESPQIANKAARLETTANEDSSKLNNQVDGSTRSRTGQGQFLPSVQNGQHIQPPHLHNWQLPEIRNLQSVSTSNLHQPGPHARKFSYAHAPLASSANNVQGLMYSSATQSNDSAQQKGPPLKLASCPEPPPDRSAPAYARLRDADILSYISHAVAKLDKVKVLEILATAAMRHDDVYKEIRRSLVEEATSELKNRSKLFEHLVAQDRLDFESALREENATRAAAPATRVIQNTQEIFSEDEYDGGDDEAEVMENDPETTDILTFTENVRRVHYVLNTRYAGLRDSQQSYITLEAATKIEDQMQNISDQVVPHSLYDTKRNAISQLCKIGMMVVEANGYLGSEIQDHMVYNSVLVKSMQAVHDIMIRMEMELIYKDCSKYFEGLDKKRDICFEGFDEIVALFRGANT